MPSTPANPGSLWSRRRRDDYACPRYEREHHWNLVASNAALGPLLDGVADDLLAPPANALRIALHPRGLAPRILNLAEWRGHLLHRLQRAIALTGDEALRELDEELRSYPGGAAAPADPHAGEVMVELRLRAAGGAGGAELRFFSTLTTFGTTFDITVAELAVEAFFPADAATAAALRSAAAAAPAG